MQNYLNNNNSERNHQNNSMLKSERYAYLYKPQQLPTATTKPIPQTARRPATTSLKSHINQYNVTNNDLKSILCYFMKNRINFRWIKRHILQGKKGIKMMIYG